MLLAQISDTHVLAAGRKLFGRVDTAACLERAVAHLNALRPRPDIVLVTGDLVDDGSPAAYGNLHRMLAALESPFSLLPGNHDDRANLRAAFPHLPALPRGGEFLHHVIDGYAPRIIALDTVVPGEDGGTLCPDRLSWLSERLNERLDQPTLIAMHHPPFVTGIEEMDSINCANSAALGEIVARHPQVERIVCGHVHRPICMRWHGTVVTTAPSTAHQVALNLVAAEPVAWVGEPPACHLHFWNGANGLVTHLSYIGDFGAPQPFH